MLTSVQPSLKFLGVFSDKFLFTERLFTDDRAFASYLSVTIARFHAAMHLPEEPESPPQINIVPMIDVIFVVLTFFILSSLFLTRSEGLPVNLPSAATSESQLDQHSLVLSITSEGDLRLGNAAATLASLPEQIQARRIGDRPLLIILQADADISHGRVVAVMDQLRSIESIEIAIATQSPQLPSEP